MLMNRVMPRRPPDTGQASGGYPSAQPSSTQPEKTVGIAPYQDQGGDVGETDIGALPMLPMPAMPPGSNLPLALPGAMGGAPSPGGRSMTGAPPAGQDLFGGGEAGGMGGMGGGGDEELMRHILGGLPGGRGR
jgi:hypothetical protein